MSRGARRPPLMRQISIVGVASVLLAGAWSTLAAGGTTNPALQLERTIRTTPFKGTTVSMGDGEGSAYVASDDSLWLADDNANRIYEIDPGTGALKRTIGTAAFEKTTRYGGGPEAGPNRVEDFESMAYDPADDELYVFSGICCNSSTLPTVFRLTRRTGRLRLADYQPLPATDDFSAAGWNSADGSLYAGYRSNLHAYDYASNTTGDAFQIPDLTGILGLGFSPDGAEAYVVTNRETLVVVDWKTKTIEPGWVFDLTPYGVEDSRAVERIGSRFYVLDGKTRTVGDPLRFAVFVMDLAEQGSVTAAFAVRPSSGVAPVSVSFMDRSAGGPTGWSWDFGDGGTSSMADPVHVYDTPGTYTVTLEASNQFGWDSTTERVSVGQAACDGKPATIVGTAGDDALQGTDGPDVIQGRGGDDTISAAAGNDLVCGGPGGDILHAGRGRDRAFGDDGPDSLFGGDGPDTLSGGPGVDRGNGGLGDDSCPGVERRISC